MYYNCSNLPLLSTFLTRYIFCLRLVLAFCSHMHFFSHWATTTSSLRGLIRPVFHFKMGSSIKCLSQWYCKQTCQLVFYTVSLIAEHQAGKLVVTNYEKALVCPNLVPNPGVSLQSPLLYSLNHLSSANMLKYSNIYNPNPNLIPHNKFINS